jgi:uroporphyrinogen decarboxylase
MENDFDLKKFWQENDECLKSFDTGRPRIPIYYWLDDHFLLEEMKLPSTVRYYEDFEYRKGLHRIINDRLEAVVGRRFYSEDEAEEPVPNRFEVIMGAFWKLIKGGTPWLETNVVSIEDVKKLNNKNSTLDMKKEAFPENWREKKSIFEKTTGKKLLLGGNFSRGPATMATSILGTTNTCMFILTDPDVMAEFFAILAEKLVEYQCVLMADTGNTIKEGYQENDDNCFLFSPELYEMFCAPVLEKIFSEFAPLPSHRRYQHSDSAMGHLMPILKDLGVNWVNFGPTLHPLEIRKAMGDAVIYGQMPPFTLRNGTREEIIAMVKRDFDTVGKDGRLIECTAGSVAGGTPLENIRTYMWAVQEFGKF